ncbi:hypothetical protein NDU88_006219 [Pleurodeles waltl]|uniref:Uncharacterized protein n=1 Tax=Pleurodeles waltl TaxID=8319 RepID=A0AAV7VQS1_PLEWA|nr:hypothetical protein NDU88_006219 [Pleurodeles waltl]
MRREECRFKGKAAKDRKQEDQLKSQQLSTVDKCILDYLGKAQVVRSYLENNYWSRFYLLKSSNAAPASEWRFSRGREVSVPRCPDDQEAGACAMIPDFRVPGKLNSEDGLEPASEDQVAEESAEAESGEWEKNERRFGNRSVSRDAEQPGGPGME